MQSGGAYTLVATIELIFQILIGEDTYLLILLIPFVSKKWYRMMFFSCQAKILKLNPKYGVYALHVNSWGNMYVMG